MKISQPAGLNQETLVRMWAEYVYEGKIDSRIRPEIADGWQRCRAAGMNPANGGADMRVDEEIFQSILAENRVLIETAQPIMQSVYDVLCQSRFTLVLTDSVGYILECIGSREAQDANRAIRFAKGSLWSNLSVGTNAISVALDHDVAIQMVGAEHYCRSHHMGICSAVPIHSPDGEVVGCLDLTGRGELPHPHSLGLVIAAAQGIEGKLVLRQTAETMRAALEGGEDSVLFLSKEYRPIWANNAAKRMFQMQEEKLRNVDFRRFFPKLEWSDRIWEKGEQHFFNDVRVLTKDEAWHCSAAVYPLVDLGMPVLNVTLKPQTHLIASVNKVSGNRAVYTFGDIFTEDAEMKRVLTQARKYARYDGNILIEGESGTGKELLAQAIHNVSSKAKGPFVSVDCAAIPRDLWEFDLFGYESDMFPGVSCEGNPGKFELANHGTLFLDGISEIPLDFQNKLLRAAESHCITRVGGKEELQLDIRIIVSANHSLESDVGNRSFSPELFYRINVLQLSVPPLRERMGDIACCTEHFLERLNALYPDFPHSCSPEFLAGLQRYNWPGNVRELQNSIERACLSSPESVLGEESLQFVFASATGYMKTLKRIGDEEESGLLRSTLAICGGDVDAAAEKLGISRATLYRRLKKYNIVARKVK